MSLNNLNIQRRDWRTQSPSPSSSSGSSCEFSGRDGVTRSIDQGSGNRPVRASIFVSAAAVVTGHRSVFMPGDITRGD